MKNIIPFCLLIFSINSFAHNGESYKIEQFCQDMNVILQKVQTTAFNIANHKTTRTAEGGHFKRRLVTNCKQGHCETQKDSTPPMLHYKPNHRL